MLVDDFNVIYFAYCKNVTFMLHVHSLYVEYFMESVCVQYLRTSWSTIGNQTRERSERVRFLIQTNECVNTVRIHFPWCIMYITYILRFKFLFNDRFVAQIQVKSS